MKAATLTPAQLEWLRTRAPAWSGFAYAEACRLGAEANADDCARMAGRIPNPPAYRPFQLVERGHG